MFLSTEKSVEMMELIFGAFQDEEERREFLRLYLWAQRVSIPKELIWGERSVPDWVWGFLFKSLLWILVLAPVFVFHWLKSIYLRGLGIKGMEEIEGMGCEAKSLDRTSYLPFNILLTNVFKDGNLVKDAEA